MFFALRLACLLTIARVVVVHAEPDPSNVTAFYVRDNLNEELFHKFNITNFGYRKLFRAANVGYENNRCVLKNVEIPVILDTDSLPASIVYVNRNFDHFTICNTTKIEQIVRDCVNRTFSEMKLDYKFITKGEKMPLFSKNPAIDHPITVNFVDSIETPQAFARFSSDRFITWHFYHPSVYPDYVGQPRDFFYRARHNLRHALGLGHASAKTSVMYPLTFARDSARDSRLSVLDVHALHKLLCSPTLNLSMRPPPFQIV